MDVCIVRLIRMATTTDAFIEGFASEIVKQASRPGGVGCIELLKKADLNDIWEGIKSTTGLGERAKPTPKPISLDPRTPDQVTNQLNGYVGDRPNMLAQSYENYNPTTDSSSYLEQPGINQAVGNATLGSIAGGGIGTGVHGLNMLANKVKGHSISAVEGVGEMPWNKLTNPMHQFRVPGTVNEGAGMLNKSLRVTRGMGTLPFKFLSPITGYSMGTDPNMVAAWDNGNPESTRKITSGLGAALGLAGMANPIIGGAVDAGSTVLGAMNHTNERMSNEYGAAGKLSDLLMAHVKALKQAPPGSQDHEMLMHNLAQMREVPAPSGNEPLMDMAARGDDNPALKNLIAKIYNKNNGDNQFTFKPNAQPNTWGSRYDNVMKWLSDIGSVAAEPKALLKSNPNAEHYYGGM